MKHTDEDWKILINIGISLSYFCKINETLLSTGNIDPQLMMSAQLLASKLLAVWLKAEKKTKIPKRIYLKRTRI